MIVSYSDYLPTLTRLRAEGKRVLGVKADHPYGRYILTVSERATMAYNEPQLLPFPDTSSRSERLTARQDGPEAGGIGDDGTPPEGGGVFPGGTGGPVRVCLEQKF